LWYPPIHSLLFIEAGQSSKKTQEPPELGGFYFIEIDLLCIDFPEISLLFLFAACYQF